MGATSISKSSWASWSKAPSQRMYADYWHWYWWPFLKLKGFLKIWRQSLLLCLVLIVNRPTAQCSFTQIWQDALTELLLRLERIALSIYEITTSRHCTDNSTKKKKILTPRADGCPSISRLQSQLLMKRETTTPCHHCHYFFVIEHLCQFLKTKCLSWWCDNTFFSSNGLTSVSCAKCKSQWSCHAVLWHLRCIVCFSPA